MQKTEHSDGPQMASLAPFSLLTPDMSSLERELVNKKRENKTKQRQGKGDF